ncbi:Nectin-1 [Bagarius yarrelli]|uniref:Nectin-1 n=1 Tax=Bagarius yarrelli TaxID=175774 RepID=A0A556V1B4_BAGYA|nr:Nectin-1 [Bagarius yarrelli]
MVRDSGLSALLGALILLSIRVSARQPSFALLIRFRSATPAMPLRVNMAYLSPVRPASTLNKQLLSFLRSLSASTTTNISPHNAVLALSSSQTLTPGAQHIVSMLLQTALMPLACLAHPKLSMSEIHLVPSHPTRVTLAHCLVAQKVKVEPEVVSYPGQTVTLRCLFPNPGQTQLTQVSWIIESKTGSRTNIAVYHPTFGVNYPTSSPVHGRVSFMMEPPSLENPTIQITDIALTDEGKYLSKPVNSATTITVPAGTSPVAVALCESANGRPPATINWITSLNGNGSAPVKSDNSDKHSDGAERVQIVGYDNNWYIGRTNVVLTCQFHGNPIPTTVNWKVSSGFMPDTVEVSQNKLTVLKVDDVVNTTFICEPMRRPREPGRRRDRERQAGRRMDGQMETDWDRQTGTDRERHAQRQTEGDGQAGLEAPMPPSNVGVVAGAVIGSLLALLLVGALIAVLIMRSRRQQQGYRGNSKGNSAPYDSVARLFGSSGSKNGTGNHGNNNAPIYKGDVGLSEKSGNIGLHQGGVALVENTPTAQDILLSGELDEAERRKFDELEDEDERYDQFRGSGPILQLRPHDEDPNATYLDDDMESQRDGSIISRTAVYV